MRLTIVFGYALAGALCSTSALAQQGAPKPNLVLQQIVEGLPKDDRQEVRVLTATVNPGGKTPPHTHRFPVTVYVLEGAFTLELKGRAPITVKAGEAMTEPPHTEMTGYNPSKTDPTKVVIFYVSTPNTPFLDLLHGSHAAGARP